MLQSMCRFDGPFKWSIQGENANRMQQFEGGNQSERTQGAVDVII